uniref:DNA-directed RNA polymerase III subunit RPC4 n=2 Tax=Sus scrofa TaxID=9823 RepID=A0A8D1UFB9_PIG
MSEGNAAGDPSTPGGSRPLLPGTRGLIGRRPAPSLTPGRLPSIRSRDLTLGGVKKKTFTPNIISRKIKEEPKEEVAVKKEKRERDRDRQREGHGRGRGRPEVIQSHSIFEQGPAEMMKKKGTKLPGLWEEGISGFQVQLPTRRARAVAFPCLLPVSSPCCWPLLYFLHHFPQGTGIRPWTCWPCCWHVGHASLLLAPSLLLASFPTGNWDKTVDMSDIGPSHIINIKKEKRETDEETKQILRMLEKDDFIDDPGLRNDTRNTPVQLPLAHSGWLFKEEDEEADVKPWLPGHKEEDMDVDGPAVKVKEEPRDEEEETKVKAPPRATRKTPSLPKDVSVAELLRELSLTQEEELLFLQLPDSLPGQPPTQDIKPVKTEVQGEDGQMVVIKQEKDREARLAENTCTLADLTEGQVGKLLIRKSGKVQLLLGKVTLDVTMGTACSFLQELVSVGLGDSRTGEMTVLGHVKHKLVCSPNFESLLDHKHR